MKIRYIVCRVMLLKYCGGGSNDAPAPDIVTDGTVTTTPADTSATVKGRVLDHSGDPIGGVGVQSMNTMASTVTHSSRAFSLKLAAGAHRLSLTRDKATIGEMCLAAAENVAYDLGDIDPITPSNCDEICTN